jgi:hypothetical protein
MAGTIKLPLVGQIKTSYAVVAGAALAGVLGFAYYKHAQAASAAASSGTTTAADTAAAAAAGSAGVDPLTGQPYGTEADQQALLAEQESAGGGLPFGGLGGSAGDQFELIPSTATPGASASTSNTGPGTFTSNANWLSWVLGNLTSYSSAQITQAVSLWWANQPLSATEMTIVQEAQAIGGPLPSPEPAPRAAATPAPGTGTGSTGAAPVKIPAVAGESASAALAKVEAAGFKSHTSPLRNPRNEYRATGTSPSGTAPHGSTVVVHVKITKKG